MAYFLSTEFESLKHDINKLFSNFHQKQSVRFDDFCEEWKKLNFSCIFGATLRNTIAAKMRITERMFRIASEFLSEDSTFLYRVAAIYTFYAVFFKQVTPVKVKVRMTPTMWSDLMQFLEILKEHKHYDVVYIIHMLRKNKAFYFTAFPKEIFFGRNEFMLGIEGTAGFRDLEERENYLSEVLDEKNITGKLKSIQNDYNNVKQKLLEESKESEVDELSRVLFYINQDFPEDISNMISSYKRKYENESTSNEIKQDENNQRPIITQLRDLDPKKSKKEKSNLGFEKTEKELTGRALEIFNLKEKFWSKNIEVDKSKGYEIQKEILTTDDDLPGGKMYKKSAMLQTNPKFQTKKRKNMKYLRYKPFPEHTDGEEET